MFVRVYVTASPSIPVTVSLTLKRSGGGSYSVPGPIKTTGIKTVSMDPATKQADQDGAFVFDVPGSEVRGGPLTLEADVKPAVKASCAAGEICGGTKLTGIALQKTKSFAIHTIELTRGGKRPSSPDAPLAVAQRLLPLSDATPFTYSSQGTSIEVGTLFTNQVCATDAAGRLVCRAPTRLEILTRLYNTVMDSELDDTDPKDISLGLVNGTSGESLGMGSTFFGSQDAVKYCGLSTKGRRNTTCHPASMVDPQRRYMTLVSHEMFHNFKLQHASAACGGGTSATAWPPDEQGYLQGYGFDPSRTSATGSSSGDNPFLVGPQGPVGAGGALGPLFDLMAYCAPNDDTGERYSWISPRNYLGAMATLSGGAIASAAHADPPARGAREQEGRRQLARAAQAGGSGLYVSGFVSPTDASAELGSVRPTTPGAVTARALRSQLGSTSLVNLQTVDAAGKVVAETSMTPLEVHGDGTAAAQPVQMLRALVPSAGIDELRLVVPKTGIVLGSRKRSPNAPTVALKGLRKGQLLKGAPKLKVAAADKDGGALTLTTQVSVDGGKRWRTVASGPKVAKIALRRGALPATNNGRIRVLANDGWNETIALSPRLRFAGEPPQVRLASPAKPYRLIAGRPLSLVASAIDENGKRLTGNKLTWRIDGKVVGRGPSVTVKKRPKTGRRKVVLTAVDGKRRTTTVKFVLKVDKPKK
jgi:hypothetical protein